MSSPDGRFSFALWRAAPIMSIEVSQWQALCVMFGPRDERAADRHRDVRTAAFPGAWPLLFHGSAFVLPARFLYCQARAGCKPSSVARVPGRFVTRDSK